MTRFIMPIILVGVAIGVFLVFTNPMYTDLSALQATQTSYNQALDNSKALENQRDVLTAKYNAINPDNLAKLQKFLPDNVDNIRLILEIEQVAAPYGMVLKNVKYDATDPNASSAVSGAKASPKDYGIFDLEFSTTGTYSDFINFTKDLENNLRIVDISSILFSADNSNTKSPLTGEVYNYDFHIKTYWLKN